MITFLSNNTSKEEFVPFPDLAPPPVKHNGFKFNPNLIYTLVLSASILAIGFSGYVIYNHFRTQESHEQAAAPTPSPAPNPDAEYAYVVLPSGKQTYNFSHGKDVTGPKPTQLVINPLDISQGSNQSVTIKVEHNSPVMGAAIEIISDNTISRQTLSLTEGNNTQGTWSGSWSLADSVNHKYGIRLLLQSTNGRFDNTMWFRQTAGVSSL